MIAIVEAHLIRARLFRRAGKLVDALDHELAALRVLCKRPKTERGELYSPGELHRRAAETARQVGLLGEALELLKRAEKLTTNLRDLSKTRYEITAVEAAIKERDGC